MAVEAANYSVRLNGIIELNSDVKIFKYYGGLRIYTEKTKVKWEINLKI